MKLLRLVFLLCAAAAALLSPNAWASVCEYNSDPETIMVVKVQVFSEYYNPEYGTYEFGGPFYEDHLASYAQEVNIQDSYDNWTGSEFASYYYYTYSISWISENPPAGGGSPDPRLNWNPVAGSPSVTAQAWDAALDGGNRYCKALFNNLVAVVNPQTYADALGCIAGYVTNIADPTTRTQTLEDTRSNIQSLAVAQTWKDAGAYLATPEGIADIVTAVVTEATPTAFGTVKIPQLPNGLQSTKTRIGATGRVGEQFLENTYGGIAQKRFVTSEGGVRYVDVFANGTAYESKVGYTSLTSEVQRQIAKDIDLLNSGQIQNAEWHFFISPVTGEGGPTAPLRQALEGAGIKVVVHNP